MGTTAKAEHAEEEPTVFRDLSLTAAIVTAGLSAELENRQGTIVFVFRGNQKRLKEIESAYWAGTLQQSSRDLLTNQRTLKNRLYEVKNFGR